MYVIYFVWHYDLWTHFLFIFLFEKKNFECQQTNNKKKNQHQQFEKIFKKIVFLLILFLFEFWKSTTKEEIKTTKVNLW